MDKFLVLPFVEFEIRLGTIGKNNFDSSVDKRYFEKIKKTLESGSWVSVCDTESTEYVKDNLKLRNFLILKENVLKKDIQLKSSPFDIRIAINQEFSLKKENVSFSLEDSLLRNKKRKSFIAETFRYDLTEVNEKKNNINKVKYEIEIELLVTPDTLDWTDNYINDFIECKIYDLVNIIEPIERELFKIK
jgi:hypothetical protein